jgi:phosphate-selective porin OprO and OprP
LRKTLFTACLVVIATRAMAGDAGGFHRGDKGFELGDETGNWFANIDLRMQLRYSAYDSDQGSDDGAELSRLRLKIGGNAFSPALTYYFEEELTHPQRLLDLRLTYEMSGALQLRVGQWKVPYNRERVDSSGNQQFVERSIVTPAFTLDRQRGIAVFGHVAAGTPADSWYNVGMFTPLGRSGYRDYQSPLLLGRWQWNFLGRDLDFSQGDLEFRERPAASLAVAAARYRGPYTSFSSAGGGELAGFEPGTSDRYAVQQWMFETAAQYKGLSWQQEWHNKRIDDTLYGRVTHLEGGYMQAGVLPHGYWPQVPKSLEFALRYAQVDPDRSRPNDLQTEWIVAANWFFNGHRDKLTADYSWLSDERLPPDQRYQRRLRLQWDFSL